MSLITNARQHAWLRKNIEEANQLQKYSKHCEVLSSFLSDLMHKSNFYNVFNKELQLPSVNIFNDDIVISFEDMNHILEMTIDDTFVIYVKLLNIADGWVASWRIQSGYKYTDLPKSLASNMYLFHEELRQSINV